MRLLRVNKTIREDADTVTWDSLLTLVPLRGKGSAFLMRGTRLQLGSQNIFVRGFGGFIFGFGLVLFFRFGDVGA